jgi:hypothetical protein
VAPDHFGLRFVHGIGKGSHLLPQLHTVSGKGDFEVVTVVQGCPRNEQGDDRQRKGGDAKGLASVVPLNDELAPFIKATDFLFVVRMTASDGITHS